MTRNHYRGTGRAILLAAAYSLLPQMIPDAAATNINMDVIPTLRLEGGWDSNAFNTSTNEVSSFGSRLIPALALRFTSLDNVALTVSGNYEIVRYAESEAKKADYENWGFRIESTGAWAFTPNLSMIPSVYYLNTVRSSQRAQQVPSGDPVLPPVSIINYGNTNTEDFGGGVNFNYLATENTTIGLGGFYSEQRFTDSAPGSGVTDSLTYGGNASVSYLYSPRTTLGIIFAGNHQNYSNAPDADTLSGGITFRYTFSPPFRVGGAFGWSFIRQNEAPGIPELKESAPSGLIRFEYAAERFTTNVYGSAVYSGGSGYGQATRQWTAGISMFDQFAGDWSWTLNGAYQVSKSVFVEGAVNLTTIYGTAVLSYRPWEWISLNLTGYLDWQTSDGQFGSDLSNYVATLGITIGKPFRVL